MSFSPLGPILTPTITLLSTLVVLLIIILYHIYLPPSYLIRYVSRLYPTVLFHLPTTKPILMLTIDDVPSTHTARIAEILHAHNIHATFFVIGSQIPGHESTLRSLVAQGHELANHAMYDKPSFRLSDEVLEREIKEVEGRVKEIYDHQSVLVDDDDDDDDDDNDDEGDHTATATDMSTRTIGPVRIPPRYFRPGSGFFTARMLALLSSLEYKCVLGSIYPHDAQIRWSWLNTWHILRSVRPGGIVICHDRPWTPKMLEVVLPELKRRGFSVGSLSEGRKWEGVEDAGEGEEEDAVSRGAGGQSEQERLDKMGGGERVKRS
ncbi:hypothetical protein PV10_02656 [Exophiala mesophila]|uniref:chitin deacetylase n=1 Tax=Exophiala mesophila TaxID=212818 RepID=A0A0D1ZK19_EXOME|nr:uncharacterized protein PV10_02656 [Exophiala mesophila]KIV94942.1 hypothetical protein PV10_02656 [Exophiala mesophila]